MKTVLIYSGGLDSTVLLYKLLKEKHKIECLHFCYGSKHQKEETDAAIEICNLLKIPLQIIKLDFIERLFESSLLQGGEDIPEGHYESKNMKSTVVPFRNGIMLSIAVGYAESLKFDRVSIATHSGDHHIYPDCTLPFLGYMKEASIHGTYNEIIIDSPLSFFNKTDIVSFGQMFKVPFEKTWTCYKGEKIHCGVCGSCVERKEAFYKAGVKDPTQYKEVDNVSSK